MGKCSGLKGGGHHRKAIDVAEKKKNEKAARKKEQAASGKRAVILKEILTELDPDCDLYMDAEICDSAASDGSKQQTQQLSQGQQQQQQQPFQSKKQNSGGAGLPDLCRANFRHEACSNKRCKFSHEHSITEALSNIVSGTNQVNDYDDGPQTLPALRHLPGMLGNNQSKKKTSLRRWRLSHDHDRPLSILETALSEGSSAVDRIVACLDSDQDVLNFGTTCWNLFGVTLGGDGCPDVQRRKYRARERKLDRRNAMLLANKSMAGGLRYAVSYFESSSTTSSSTNSISSSTTTTSSASSKKKKKSKNNRKPGSSLRPVLVFDYENPNVYKAFRESGLCKAGLESSLAKKCTVAKLKMERLDP